MMKHWNEIIPVCFATNEEYLGLTTVAIQSIIENSSENNYYDIHILHSEILQSEQNKITDHFSSKTNINIQFDDVKKYIENNSFYIDSNSDSIKYSKETYYRFLIPEILNQYEKVIYLDGDTITLADIKELYDIDIENNLIGAVRDYYGIFDCLTSSRGNYMKTKLKIENINDIIIAGVLIINNREFNKKYKWQDLMAISSSYNWRQHDQDVLNMICHKKIKLINPEWNVMPLYPCGIFEKLPENINKEFQSSYYKKKKIIHYGSWRKPWKKGYTINAKEFWIYASKTPYFYELLNKCESPEIRWLAIASVYGINSSINDNCVVINQIKVFNLSECTIRIYNYEEKNNNLQISGFAYVPWLKENETTKFVVRDENCNYDLKSELMNKDTKTNSYYNKTLKFDFAIPIVNNKKFSIYLLNNNREINCKIICKNKKIEYQSKIFQLKIDENTIEMKIINKLKVKFEDIVKKAIYFIKK